MLTRVVTQAYGSLEGSRAVLRPRITVFPVHRFAISLVVTILEIHGNSTCLHADKNFPIVEAHRVDEAGDEAAQ